VRSDWDEHRTYPPVDSFILHFVLRSSACGHRQARNGRGMLAAISFVQLPPGPTRFLFPSGVDSERVGTYLDDIKKIFGEGGVAQKLGYALPPHILEEVTASPTCCLRVSFSSSRDSKTGFRRCQDYPWCSTCCHGNGIRRFRERRPAQPVVRAIARIFLRKNSVPS